MRPKDYPDVWPRHMPQSLSIPDTTLWYNVEVSARRFPEKAATVFYESRLSYAQFQREAEALAGFLQERCSVRAGDRVVLDMQNSPQFVLAFYAILRAGAVVVPVSPMNVTEELEHYLSDAGAATAIVGQEVYERFRPLLGTHLTHVIVAAYSDYLTADTDLAVPEALRASRQEINHPAATQWQRALAAGCRPQPLLGTAADLCAILYTSGTTGKPKGCMHTHASLMFTAVGGALWEGMLPDSVVLATAPFFHVTGMQHSMNAAIYSGASIVLLPRWDPEAAGHLFERLRCTHWANVPTMVVDLLAHPSTAARDLSSLRNVFGGGAAMPEAVAQQLYERCGIEYMEAYGMTETISQTHMNPPGNLRKQCLGIPTFDTESLIIDADSGVPLGPRMQGEIVSHGPGLFQGYWNNPEATQAALIDIDGRRFLRTGDLGYYDEDGFFYIADRLKRMINAAGYKVWPAEVEMTLYKHPDIQEVAVVSAPDARRGETVKAVVVLKRESRGKTSAKDIAVWARAHMAAYKVPRIVEFTEVLPRSSTGKIHWRVLQERAWDDADTA